jgi:hypothetical protein
VPERRLNLGQAGLPPQWHANHARAGASAATPPFAPRFTIALTAAR